MRPAFRRQPARRRAGRLPVILLACFAAVTGGAAFASQPASDLTQAADYYREGDLGAARALYLDLLAAGPLATVYYNLGRVDQDLGAHAQAVLWYRRALLRAPGDPWARENLERLRSDLGLPEPDRWQPIAVLHRVVRHSVWVAVAGLWVMVAMRGFTGRPRGWALIVSAAGLASGYLVLPALSRVAPADAVLMADCAVEDHQLPAGSEVWMSRRDPGHVWTAGGRFQCDPESVLRIDSSRLPPTPTFPAVPSPGGTEDSDGSGVSSDSEEAAPFV